jgi:hypothetical protein
MVVDKYLLIYATQGDVQAENYMRSVLPVVVTVCTPSILCSSFYIMECMALHIHVFSDLLVMATACSDCPY